MSFRLKEADCKALECLADHRMLTVAQLSAISQKSMQVVRRRVRDLEEVGLVEVIGREYGRGRGRPERSFGLTSQGVDILRQKGLIDRAVPYDKVVASDFSCADHQLLLNWFRIHLAQVERVLPRLNVKFLACNSPYLPQGPNGPVALTDCSPVAGHGIREVQFTPDAVFATCCACQAPIGPLWEGGIRQKCDLKGQGRGTGGRVSGVRPCSAGRKQRVIGLPLGYG